MCFRWLSLTLSWWTVFAALVYIAIFALTYVKPFKLFTRNTLEVGLPNLCSRLYNPLVLSDGNYISMKYSFRNCIFLPTEWIFGIIIELCSYFPVSKKCLHHYDLFTVWCIHAFPCLLVSKMSTLTHNNQSDMQRCDSKWERWYRGIAMLNKRSV